VTGLLKLLLLNTSLLLAQDAAMECSNNSAAQTQPVKGPAGASAILKIAAADDHGKNTHLCLAEYTLLLVPATAAVPVSVQIASSDAAWGRPLAARLEGFSRDGRRVYGIASEQGEFPLATLFEYDLPAAQMTRIDLKKALKALAGARCGASLSVAGITASGAIVVRPATPDACRKRYRWQIDRATGNPRRVPSSQSIAGLYE
jgi:hypothetical protein